MDTYIINLKDSLSRRHYMENLLEEYEDVLQLHFIDAFDGRKLTQSQMQKLFNQDAAFKHYGRTLLGGEIGCTLSHRKCCEILVNNNCNVALVLEDDLILQQCDFREGLRVAESYLLNENGPAIVLLSGDYWYYYKKQITSDYALAKVREAVCTQAYLINNEAARVILNMPLCYLADDWFSIKKAGVQLFALYPHIADQDRVSFETEISDLYQGFNRKELTFIRRVKSYARAIIKRVLLVLGKFESKNFKS